jgi:hypothetical protein
MSLKILILTNLLFLALTGCTSEQVVDPKVAQDMIATAWHSDQHAVWQLDWPAAPIGGPVTVETWQANQGYRFEILESTAPALVGQTLVSDGQSTWRYNRFESNSLEMSSLPLLSPVSDAFEVIDRLINTPAASASQQESTTLNHGPARKIDQKTGLPARIIYSVRGGDQAELQARSLESLIDPPERLFRPEINIRR